MSKQSQSEQSLAETNRSLYEDGMTDGLPVIPPTEDRVEEMLRGTDHVLGELGNQDNPLTVERLAANAVMAGRVFPTLPTRP